MRSQAAYSGADFKKQSSNPYKSQGEVLSAHNT